MGKIEKNSENRLLNDVSIKDKVERRERADRITGLSATALFYRTEACFHSMESQYP